MRLAPAGGVGAKKPFAGPRQKSHSSSIEFFCPSGTTGPDSRTAANRAAERQLALREPRGAGESLLVFFVLLRFSWARTRVSRAFRRLGRFRTPPSPAWVLRFFVLSRGYCVSGRSEFQEARRAERLCLLVRARVGGAGRGLGAPEAVFSARSWSAPPHGTRREKGSFAKCPGQGGRRRASPTRTSRTGRRSRPTTTSSSSRPRMFVVPTRRRLT